MNQHPIFSEHPGLVIVFAIAVVIMLLLDLGIFNKKSHVVSNKEAVTWSLVWISLAMIFSGLVYHFAGSAKFYEFQSAYWIEKALSVDNLFVFILVFKFFDVANQNKHKVLFWGIIGALVLRAIFIFSGAFLIELTYLNKLLSFAGIPGFKYDINLIMTAFGLFLVYAGIKSWSSGDEDEDEDYNNTRGARLIRKFFSVSDKYDGDKFFTYENGKKLATPLLVVVAVIEFTDLLFAVDSIPAIFAISNDPFILYTSNIFAILGLRALFFLLDNFIHLFSKLQYGLAIILSFIGVKMIISPFYHVDSVYSLLVIGGVLLISVVASIMLPEVKEA
ncbi:MULTISPECIES: TerC/Alx family metal homeostasis membrane protein [Flavobacterium]|jgi:tellurite resistance protein TerC|uniref:TerC/Alx family metal homeostasis membrane protein n=1 Tax=Flavobacterium cupriresistens TaxID=2893885 RepID=A0ABU4R8C6_9FLAO|nr:MULTISPECIES: TerC/Alx family metal homeostasis membrane protein [unclassified Flavobacterium]KLT68444.1 membrane protein [Flavobacterium sp. ABG]MDX6188832.1 TerC/Alx family metal homeostasis membrane protein [Flavobacterium sp. Fl-318]UFH44382.1 TerC/Alx family metal homeostasis membrane protein [Flavobacterium sp. F-323]